MSYNLIAIVREVWDTRDLIASPLDEAGAIKAGAMMTRFEPEDLNALEAALRIKDAHGGKVTAIAVGVPRGVEVLRECLYRGADAVLQVNIDPAGLDSQALGALLAGAVRKAGAFDLVLVGTSVVDGDNSQLGAHVAAALGIDPVSWVDAIEEISVGRAVAKRAVEMGYEFVEVKFPALLSIGVALLEDDPRTPRSAKAMLKLKMKKAEIPALTAAEAGVADPAAAATTRTVKMESIPPRVIESKTVDPEDPAALRAMLDEVLKGE